MTRARTGGALPPCADMCGIGAILDPTDASRPRPWSGWSRPCATEARTGTRFVASGRSPSRTRLAIIDVAGGDQPLDSEDGRVTAVVNGEIYNQRELRTELEARGHRFATNSDSEVVVHAYEEHGLDCVRHLNGIFAFALWDDRERRLVAARDEFGVKPLYWCTDGRRTAWRRDRRADRRRHGAAGRRPRGARPLPRLPLRALAAHAVRGVSKLPPASTLVVLGGQAAHRELACGPRLGVRRRIGRRKARRAARRALLRRRRAPDDVGRPLRGVPLGGVDSAAVVAAMAVRATEPPTTFTIGFPGHGDVLDERGPAAESARLIGASHHSTTMEEPDFLARSPGRCPGSRPCGIPSAPALLQLSRFAAEQVKVVLAGQGRTSRTAATGAIQARVLLNGLRLVPSAAAAPPPLARRSPRGARRPGSPCSGAAARPSA